MNILEHYQRSSHPLHLIRHHLRSMIYASSKTKFVTRINKTESLQRFFTNYPAVVDLPLKRYLDNRWSVSQRYTTLSVDLENSNLKIGKTLFEKISQNTSVKLFDLGVYSIHLELNSVCLWEGLWALSIKDITNRTVYNLSFAFIASDSILIGSVQGIKVLNNSDYELQRNITKMTFGLRPPNLLIATLQALCSPWGIKDLIGIDPKYMGTKKYFGIVKKIKFDYTNFWKELEGIETTQGYWQIPSFTPVKDLEEVSSNKRSKYRNRNFFLERLLTNCQEIFNQKNSDISSSTSSNSSINHLSTLYFKYHQVQHDQTAA